jgi:hypothetical protein
LMTEPKRLHDRLMLKANASSLPCKTRQRHNRVLATIYVITYDAVDHLIKGACVSVIH